ncbi:hypothetical protein GIB67_043089 [Kingdonia uniflora]|uniref:Protein TIC 20 n=1 Tax=Kingdonia uniflora TaxID=39325 RepID=A0A7J7MGT2_9MAGN|nr:hypothetical protein GIB67_043089 [Kingdonia uniflora]
MSSLPLLRLSLRPSPQTLKPPHSLFQTSTVVRSPNSLYKSTLLISPPSTLICNSSYQAVPATERLISAVAYCLPFFNGLQYGRFVFTQYPKLGLLLDPILPLLNLYRSIPYASFVAFFALYLGVVRNPSFTRYVRFNSMQAVVLDVLLVLPLLVQRVFSPGSGVGLRLLVTGYNAIFVFIVMCFGYSLGHCIVGRTPYLPFVADAADRQL